MSGITRAQRRKCKRKAGHETVGAAYAQLKRAEKKGIVGLEIYPCPVCNKFHVGHSRVAAYFQRRFSRR